MVALLSFQWDRRTGLGVSLEQWHPHMPKAFAQHSLVDSMSVTTGSHVLKHVCDYSSCVPEHVCGGQRTTFRSWSLPFHFLFLFCVCMEAPS